MLLKQSTLDPYDMLHERCSSDQSFDSDFQADHHRLPAPCKPMDRKSILREALGIDTPGAGAEIF